MYQSRLPDHATRLEEAPVYAEACQRAGTLGRTRWAQAANIAFTIEQMAKIDKAYQTAFAERG